MYPFINHNQNDVISKMFWKNLHTLFYTLYIPVHFNIEPSEIRGFLRHTTMFLPEQLVTINEEQIIQTAGMIVSTDAIKKVDAMLVRQLQIGEYDG